MEKCNPDCIPCCDFCKFMAHPREKDGTPKYDSPTWGRGRCKNPDSPNHERWMNWGESCDNFVCFAAKKVAEP